MKIARRLAVCLMMLVAAALSVAPMALATESQNIIQPQNTPANDEDGWQSANCTEDQPSPGEFCSPETPGLYFRQAGGHPETGFTQYTIAHETLAPGIEPLLEPQASRSIKTLHVELPAGLTVNPLATERCTLAEFQHMESGAHDPLCKAGTIVGYEEATLVTNVDGYELAPGFHAPRGYRVDPIPGFTKVPVYALVPAYGEPALNGFIIAGEKEVFLETDVAWQSDYHESFTIKMPEAAPQPEPPFSTLISRQVSYGKAGNGTYITNPTTCFNTEEEGFENAYSAKFKAESYGEPDPDFPAGSTAIPAGTPEGLVPTGCQKVPFEPGVEAGAGTSQVDSPAPATVETTLPFITGGETVSESHLRDATITLPAGMGLNPSATSGDLVACTDAQFKASGSREPVECPAASKIGTVEIETPPLPSGSLKGNVYLGQQLSRDPSSGEEFRIFIDAEAPEQGISVRLVGHTAADPETGQLTTEIDENPQVPFTSVKLKFDGSHSVLTSPPTCAAAQTTSTMVPWSTPSSTRHPSSSFTLSSVPGGGTCPQTLAQRKFAPTFAAGTESSKAATYTSLKVSFGRGDGEQELKGATVSLPKGLTARLKGIPYCSDSALEAAAEKSGKAEAANPSCPAESLIGGASTISGTGNSPITLAGKVYLAGPYKEAPLSLAVVTPAVSGPFDLGTVVVRAAIEVDPVTAQVTTVSDPIPDVYGGVKLDIRKVEVNLNRKGFTVTPTNCSAAAIGATLSGGGSNPTSPAAWSSAQASSAFQASGCGELGFKPKLHVRLQGPTKRAKNPQIRAVLEAPSGQANIARTALTLPHSLFLDQGHIQKVCTRPQLAAHECPGNSIYGHAEAVSPLLSKKLAGPVYMVPSNHRLPDLVADLRGQVEIQLHGIVGSKNGALKTVFNSPDVPVKKFVLNMKGGKKSLVVNSTDTCKSKQTAILHMKAQNAKKLTENQMPLNIAACSHRNG